jgi:hypothetical protein
LYLSVAFFPGERLCYRAAVHRLLLKQPPAQAIQRSAVLPQRPLRALLHVRAFDFFAESVIILRVLRGTPAHRNRLKRADLVLIQLQIHGILIDMVDLCDRDCQSLG